MPNHRAYFFLCRTYNWGVIFTIFMLGVGLRLYRLGHNLFWFDEVGVANAAGQASLRAALAVSQQYIMSMPLDYVVAWGVAQISRSEAVLRLPSVLWGSFTLLAAYFLYNELTNRRTAALAMFLLALTPIHIRYSQELKFYAALGFFYVLAHYFVIIAVKKKEPRWWILFLLITMLGILFQVYTTLVLVNLTLWVVLSTNRKQPDPRLWNSYVLSTSIVLIFAAFVIVLYGKSPSYPSELFGFEPPWLVFGGGLGWIPFFPSSGAGFLFGALCMIFAVMGFISLLSKNADRLRLAILPGILFQICLILAGDIVKQYFAHSRQFLILVPFMVLFTAIGMERTIQTLTDRVQPLHGRYYTAFLLSMCVFLFAAVPVLSQYYRAKRTDVLAVVNWLLANWHDGDTVCVEPGYELSTFHYYLQRWGAENKKPELMQMSEALVPFEMDACRQNLSNVRFLITQEANHEEVFSIEAKGFQPTYVSPFNVIQPQIVWHRVNTQE